MKRKIPNYHNFVGKQVIVILRRRGKIIKKTGILSAVTGNYIALRGYHDRVIWISRPDFINDKIELVKELK